MTDRRDSDELEIRGLLARLAHLADHGDLDEYASLYTGDAIWEGSGAPRRNGRDDILQGARERRTQGITGPSSHTLHVVSTVDVRIDHDRATSRSVFQFYVDTHESPRLQIIGHYVDEFHREAAGWKLANRQIVSM